jgi:hypothetical protein
MGMWAVHAGNHLFLVHVFGLCTLIASLSPLYLIALVSFAICEISFEFQSESQHRELVQLNIWGGAPL